MESKKINQLATELTPALSDLTIIGDPTTGISKKITLSQMASLFTGTVEEYANLAAFPLVGVADTIYIALDTNVLYRWDTGLTSYVELSPNIINSLVFSDANGFDGTISLVGSVATLTITTALTTGSVGFIGASGALTQDNDNFYWDNSNKRLGIGTKLPTTAIDVFGSGIIGRLNGTSTNNAFLGFASGGTNQWSIGNVQSDQRFRIYSEANTAELVSVLQTGEVGIGIVNPTTKLHIDGGASALIANLDANVSVAKSISFRSDNSARINLEVSGTESGSNAGADLFIRTYSDAGALLNTPFFIKRSTGNIGFGTNSPTSIASGYTSITTNGTNGGGLVMQVNGTATGYLYVESGAMVLTNTSGSMQFFNAGLQRLSIQSTGNINIDTNNVALVQKNAAGTGTVGLLRLTASDIVQIGDGGTVNPSTVSIPNGKIGFGTDTPTREAVLYRSSGEVHFKIANGTTGQGTTDGFDLAIDSSGGAYLINRENQPMYFLTNGTERMRISSVSNGGYFKASNNGTYNNATSSYHEIRNTTTENDILILTNTSASPYGINIAFQGGTPNNTTNYFFTGADNTNTKAQIYSNGTFGSRTGTYGSIVSDEKYKTEIVSANSQWEDIKKLRVVNFKLKEDVELEGENALRQIGFIAQEVEQVSPSLVYTAGTKDSEETWKSVKTSIIEIKAIKALQEAMAKIEILEAEVEILKNK